MRSFSITPLKNSRKGFTLVEVIVTLVIAVIVIAAAGSFLVYGTNFLGQTERKASDKQIAETASDYIRKTLVGAKEIKVVYAEEAPAVARGGALLYISDDGVTLSPTGRLYYMREGDTLGKAIDVLGGDYQGNALAVSYASVVGAQQNAKSFEVDVTAVRDGKVSYYFEKTFGLPNVGPASEPLAGFSAATWKDGKDGATFYLLISPASPGYATDGLIAHFDGIDNVRQANGEAHHDAGQTAVWHDISGNGHDMKLVFSNNKNPVRDQAIYFDGDGDYGVTLENLDLTAYSTITVEVVFRPASTKSGMVFEHGANWNLGDQKGGFGLSRNSSTVMHTNDYAIENDPMEYPYTSDTKTFQTHCVVYNYDPDVTLAAANGTAKSYIRQAYIDGQLKNTLTTRVNSSAIAFKDFPFYVARRWGTTGQGAGPSYYYGEIASIRIYGKKLSTDEIERNAYEDSQRFGTLAKKPDVEPVPDPGPVPDIFDVLFRDGMTPATEYLNTSVYAGTAVQAPANPEKDGYLFTGWQLVSGTGTFANVQSDLVYEAQWRTAFTVVFRDNRGAREEDKIVYKTELVGEGDAAMLPVDPSDPDYTFKEWVKVKGTGTYANVQSNLIYETVWSTQFVKVEMGSYHTLALTKDGRVYAWGVNDNGQCGIASNKDSLQVWTPRQVDLPGKAIDIDAGGVALEGISAAVLEDGSVYTWGDGTAYALGHGNETNQTRPKRVEGLVGVKITEIACGGWDMVALSDAGEVYTWGYNSEGQCGDGGSVGTRVKTPYKVTKTRAGAAPGNVLPKMVMVATGGHVGAAVDEAGNLWTWGCDATYGQLGDAADNGQDNLPDKYSGLTDVKFITGVYYDVSNVIFAITGENRVLYSFGINKGGNIGTTSTQKTPFDTGLRGVQMVAGNGDCSIALLTNQDVYVTGNSEYNKTGFGNTTNLGSFTRVTALSGRDVRWVTGGFDTTMVLIGDAPGDVYSAGWNGWHEFGNGGTTSTASGQTHLNGKWTPPSVSVLTAP
ncbi:MAG: InlB B-repeat-containing protein [Clostridiales Family XIII bacterium]|jgi:prepilin-type N-terminal cleavage/methylation domain-containing protein|nr:InlB B-repeat-containing protein [Clostridiales Family XIII bacterium]